MNKIIGLVITALVSVIVLAAVLIPVINDATTTEDTFKNEGYFRMSKIDSADDLTIVWDHTEPTTLTVNSVDVPMPDKDNMSTIPFTVACSEFWMLRYTYDTTYGYNVTIYQTSNSASYSGTESGNADLTITITSGSVVANNGADHSLGTDSGDRYVISADGDYIMKKIDVDAYVNGDSSIFAFGRTYARLYNYETILSGSVDDGITGEYYPESVITTAGWTISDVTLNYTTDSSHDDLYSVSTMTYIISGDDIEDYQAVFSQYIVPYEITAERSQHLSPAEIEILDIIPVFIIIAVLIAAVAVVAFRRE